MAETLLRTKLFIPPLRPNLIPRPHLIKRLNQGLQLSHKLTLVSAPVGFGKSTLVSDWSQSMDEATPPMAIAWLSLVESDNDLARFLAYLVAALNKIERTDSNFGNGALILLQSPQLP